MALNYGVNPRRQRLALNRVISGSVREPHARWDRVIAPCHANQGANVFCSVIVMLAVRGAPWCEQAPFTAHSLSGRAVCSQVPCSRSISRCRGEHGSFQGLELLNEEVGVCLDLHTMTIDGRWRGRRRSSWRSEPKQPRSVVPEARIARTVSGNRMPVRRRPCDCVVQPGHRQFNTTGKSQMP